MAVAVQQTISNAGTANFLSRASNDFSPSLALGDLIVAQFFSSTNGATFTMPAGWTEIIKTENAGDALTSQISYKIADAGDVSGTTWEWSDSLGSTQRILHITRITGHRATSTITTSSGQSNDASATITAPTVTPVQPESLIMFFTSANATRTVSGHTLATSPPTFTEIYDLTQTSYGVAMASGLRTAVTATGSGTVTASGSCNSIGQLVVVSSPVNTVITDTINSSEIVSAVRARAILIADTITLTENILKATARYWTNLIKNTKTWLNRGKN